jgi:hypothetical protein
LINVVQDDEILAFLSVSHLLRPAVIGNNAGGCRV